MKQRQQLFLGINRIFLLLYAPLTVALSVYFLFTGSLIHTGLSLFTLFWIAFPYFIQKLFHIRNGQLLLSFYYAFILLSYSGGIVLSLYQLSVLYDVLTHIFGGFFFSIAASAAFCLFLQRRPQKRNLWFSNAFCFSCSLAAASICELLHIAYFVLIHSSMQLSHIIGNIICAILGSIIYCILTILYVHKDIHLYPLYAFEDFAALNVKSTVEILSK